ncbi:MAG: DUF5681 domain-containing protein [Xanthobacteraceae bacterium]|jgi:hypothetical protein
MSKPKKPAVANTAIGYGKPPRYTRFKKGHSGNPKGRPRGSKNLDTLLMESVNERVTINENGVPKKVSKLAVMHKQLANKGATGDLRALKIILQKLEDLENRTRANAGTEDFDEADRAIMNDLGERLRRIARENDNVSPDKK